MLCTDKELSPRTDCPWLLLKCALLETVLENGVKKMVLCYLPHNFGTIETQLMFFLKVERGTAFYMKRDRN